MSSGTRLDVSPNGRRIIFDVDLAEESTRKNWDGAPPGIFVLDLENDSATRVSAKGSTPLIRNSSLMMNFSVRFKKRTKTSRSIYHMSIDGKNMKRLIKNDVSHRSALRKHEPSGACDLSLRRVFRAR